MDISLFFEPIDHHKEDYAEKTFGSKVKAHTKDSLPDPRTAHIAILGVKDDPGRQNGSVKSAPDHIRKELYQLFLKDKKVNIVDLGNINGGHSQQDTLFALSTILAELIQTGTIPIVLGGGKGLSFANYMAYEKLERTVNITSIDGSIDVGNMDQDLSPASYLTNIIMHRPNYLFNFSNIGFQTYKTDSAMIDLMGKLFFDAVRLGEVRGNSMIAEPIMRDSDLVLMNVSAIKAGDAPGSVDPSPNGLTAEDMCQLSMFAGLSDKVSSYAVYEFDPSKDVDDRTAKLVAEMIWCFIDGFCGRASDVPGLNKEQFFQYHVPMAGDQNITFFKSKKTDRWWIQIPYSKNDPRAPQRVHYAPCAYSDYTSALGNDIPDAWWKTYQKLS